MKTRAILDQEDLEVKWANLGRRLRVRLVRITLGGSPPASIDGKGQMQAGRRKQYVMRQHPEPVADIQSREKGREAGSQIEIGQAIVKQFGQPDFSGHEVPGVSSYFLSGAKVKMFRRGVSQHASSLLVVTVLMMTNVS